jgi:putrescine---pyruvate transaminase
MPTRFLHAFAPITQERFVSIERGEGALVWDSDGNEYVDGMASLWYCAVGHGRAEIADAVHAQMRRIEAYSTFDPFTNRWAEELCERITSLSPIADPRVFLTSGGSESVDTAMKIARFAHVCAGHPERTLIISRDRGYHGATYGGTSAQGIAPNRAGFGPMVGDVIQVAADDVEAMALVFAEHGERIAAVVTEPVQGAGGIHPPVPGYLEGLRRLCDDHGAFLIFDEVICGFGRLGTWFGADHFGVTPDMASFAKGVTSGYIPLGGVVVGAAVRAPLEAEAGTWLRTGFTYSGHPTACAAALANLDIIEREALCVQALHVGGRLRAGLDALAADGVVDHARGAGAVHAVGLRPDQAAMAVRNAMLERGAIARALATDSILFCPPLVTTDAQADRLVDALADALSVSGGAPVASAARGAVPSR